MWRIFIVHRAPVLVALALIESGMKYEDAVEFIRRYMFMYVWIYGNSVKEIKRKRSASGFFFHHSLIFLYLPSSLYFFINVSKHCVQDSRSSHLGLSNPGQGYCIVFLGKTRHSHITSYFFQPRSINEYQQI